MTLAAPFPYFGGKAAVAPIVWQALGGVKTYIEPFFGSGAVLLARPDYRGDKHIETVNDADGYVCNAWRALQDAPDEVAKVCDWPVNHADLMARKKRLVAEGKSLVERLANDDKYYDTELAGYWIWAASCWIGSRLTRSNAIPHVGAGGEGVHKLGKRPHIANGGRGVQEPYNTNLYGWFRLLSERLRYVRVVCGDWTRVCGGNWQDKVGDVGMFFDPPYAVDDRDDVYGVDCKNVAHDVRAWCIERGAKPTYRIVLAGYEEHAEELLAHGWTMKQWSAHGGYSNQGKGKGAENRHRERLYFSPACKTIPQQGTLL